MKKTNLNPEQILEKESRFEAFVDRVDWRFAKTMPMHPHWYTIKKWKPQLSEVFDEFTQFIIDYGYEETFFNVALKYYNLGKFKYWSMNNLTDDNRKEKAWLINRALIESTDKSPRGI